MPFESLLPSNATALEKGLEASFQSTLDVSQLRGFKTKPEAMGLIFEDLVQEYGLEEVRLWIQDASKVLEEGILFQRLRGTPAAMKMALKWTGLENVVIEEAGPGEHFAEFQLGLEGLPSNLSVEALVALADMAKPARSRFSRLYNSLYDKRRLVLDENDYGDYLSGDSGVMVDGLQISLGREQAYAVSECLLGEPIASILRDHLASVTDRFVFRLDDSLLDGEKTELWDPGFVHEHAFIFEVQDCLANTEHAIQEVHSCLAKSHLILDDGFELDSVNTALGASTLQEIGGQFVLDSDDTLSNHQWRQERVEILERFYEKHSLKAHVDTEFAFDAAYQRHHYEMAVSSPAIMRIHRTMRDSLTARYPGVVVWHDHKHREKAWSDEEVVVAYTQNKN